MKFPQFLPIWLLAITGMSAQPCIQVMPTACVGDCKTVVYTPNDPPGTTYTWTNSCGTISNPNAANPHLACFLTSGVCTLSVVVQPPGLAPSTCTAYVEVSPEPKVQFGMDDTLCQGSCANLTLSISGPGPYQYTLDDGMNAVTYQSAVMPVNISVCPQVSTTYSISAAQNSLCSNQNPMAQAVITVVPGFTASLTQAGNQLCAQPGGMSYTWYTCMGSPLPDTTACTTVSGNGCNCVIVDNGVCRDTACLEYFLCDDTCQIVAPDAACLGDTVLVYFNSNIGSNPNINWLASVDSFPNLHFFGEDTLMLVYTVPGCYNIDLFLSAGNCTTSCQDTVCVYPPPKAEICCEIFACDSCATIPVTLTGTPPWTIAVWNGFSMDTITGIFSSPYPYVVCPPPGSTFAYTIAWVQDSTMACQPSGTGTAYVHLVQPPNASISVNGNQLCANPSGLAYGWYACPSGGYLSTSQCFVPTMDGCYCVDVSTLQADCVDTACVQITLTQIPEKGSALGLTRIWFHTPSGMLKILWPEALDDLARIRIINPLGQLLQEVIAPTSGTLSIPGIRAAISAQVLFVQIQTKQGWMTRAIVPGG